MRSAFVLWAIGVGACSTAHAQQPDSAATPRSAARADSVARADSLLLDRELRRIRGEPRARVSVRAAQSRTERAVLPRVELGAAISTPYLKDANGATVRANAAPVVSLGLARAIGTGAPTSATLDVRATRAAVSVRQGGDETAAGSAWQVDVTAGVERWRGRAGLRAAAGVSWLRGEADVSPFRFGNARPWHLVGEVGALARLARGRPLSVLLAAQGMRFGTASGGSGGTSGAVIRMLAGVRYGR